MVKTYGLPLTVDILGPMHPLLALAEPDLSPREIAVKFTDQRGYYVCESTVYRILKENDLSRSRTLVKRSQYDVVSHSSRRR
jgi:hypothetical protein